MLLEHMHTNLPSVFQVGYSRRMHSQLVSFDDCPNSAQLSFSSLVPEIKSKRNLLQRLDKSKSLLVTTLVMFTHTIGQSNTYQQVFCPDV